MIPAPNLDLSAARDALGVGGSSPLAMSQLDPASASVITQLADGHEVRWINFTVTDGETLATDLPVRRRIVENGWWRWVE